MSVMSVVIRGNNMPGYSTTYVSRTLDFPADWLPTYTQFVNLHLLPRVSNNRRTTTSWGMSSSPPAHTRR